MTLWNRTSLWVGERLADLAWSIGRFGQYLIVRGERLHRWANKRWIGPSMTRQCRRDARGAFAPIAAYREPIGSLSETEIGRTTTTADTAANEEIYRMWAERQ